jgi:hypothetical protein
LYSSSPSFLDITDGDDDKIPPKVAYAGPAMETLLRLGVKTYISFLKDFLFEKLSPPSLETYEMTQISLLNGFLGKWVTWCPFLSPFIEVKETVWGAGKGMFVATGLSSDSSLSGFMRRKHGQWFLKANTIVSFYGGVLLHKGTFQQKKRNQTNSAENRFNYAMGISFGFLIDAWGYERYNTHDMAHFANHAPQRSCNASLKREIHGHVFPHIITREDIREGEEVKVFYSKYYDDLFKLVPLCDSGEEDSSGDPDWCSNL